MDPQTLTRIGPYPVRRFIAEGGMAWVFEVADPDAFDAPRALKMLKPGMGEDIFRRFKEEAGILTRIDHPNLITIYKFGKDEESGCHYYTMTLLTGGHLGRRGVIPLEEAGEIFLGVLGGLARLHENNIIHRDIKPSNILLGADRWPKLADLGIARTADLSEGETWHAATRPGVTSTGIAIGTPAYMSPEQARGQRGIGKQTDVFSLGLTLYAALTGHSIYDEIPGVDSTSGMDILQYLGHLRLSRGEFEFRFDSEDVDHPIPPSVQDVIRTACAIDPAVRYADARVMQRALKQALADPEGSTGEHVPPDDREPGWGRAIALSAGVVLVLLAGAGGYWFWRERGPTPPPVAQLSRENVSELERAVTRVIETAEAARPSVPAEVIAAARKKHGAALTLLELSATKPDFLPDSQTQFFEACQLLVAGDLEARFKRGVEEAKRVEAGLRELQVKELAAAEWTRLEGQLKALIPPEADASTCVQAVHYQSKVGETEAALRTGREIEKKLEQEWPRLADAARNEALHEQSATAQMELDAPEFLAPLARGREQLAAGDAAVVQQSFLAARDEFWNAKDSFAEAAVVADAAGAGVKAREALARTSALKIRDAASEAQVARADELMKEKRFGEAKEAYQQATRFLDVAEREATQSAGARRAREIADRAHEAANQAGADRSALAEVGLADEAYSAATAAFEQKAFAEAERAYAAAAKAYTDARSKAGAEVERARKEGVAAKAAAKEFAKAESCNGDGLSEAARASCQSAHQSLADGDGAVAAGDSAAAMAAYGRASEAFEETRETRQADIANQPKAPTITSRKPVADSVTAAKGESVRFEIAARDPNAKDVLRYAWTIDGVAQAETGSQLDFVPDGTKRVEVAVADGGGLEARAGWTVTVKNRPPTVALTPSAESTQIEPGARVAFSAQTSDPDGEEVQVAYFVNDSHASDGPAFEFQGTKEGRFVVEARATDPSGGEKRVRRNVEVKSKNEPPTVALQPAQTRLELDEGKTLRFEATAEDPEEEPVRLAYFVDGKKASDGPSFTYTARAPGRHVVEVRATDAKGLTATTRRTIDVASVAPPPLPTPAPPIVDIAPVPTPAPPVAVTPPAPTPAPPTGDGDAYVKHINQTMSLYKQYFEARNVGGMSGVWNMSMMDKIEMQGLFGQCAAGRLEVSLKPGKPVLKGAAGNQATLEFTQVVKCNGGVIRSEARVANLILRGTDEWQIKTMQTR